jgi:hypothetical protein
VRERLQSLRYGLPVVLHAQGEKPWLRKVGDAGGLMEGIESLLSHEVSPYLAAARDLEREVEIPLPWTRPESWLGRLSFFLSCGQPGLAGLPVAIAYEAARALMREDASNRA